MDTTYNDRDKQGLSDTYFNRGKKSDLIPSSFPEKSYYVNPHIYSNLKPSDINQPSGKVYED